MELQLVLPGIDMQPAPPVRHRPTDVMVCHECEESYTFSEGVFIDLGAYPEYYCDDDCANDAGWVTCMDCDDWVKEDDSEMINHNYVCDDCFNESYFRCHCCDDIGNLDESYSDPDGNNLCEHCYCDNYTGCSHCGDTVHNDDVVCRDDDYYCSSCDPGDGNHIGENYTESTTYHNVTNRCFGVELEYSEADSSEQFVYFTNQWEHCGRELVSGILRGDGGLEAVRNLTEYAERNNWGVDDTCGYHLHIDCRDLVLDQLKGIAWAYTKSHALWEAFVDPSRADGMYSKFIYPTRMDLTELENINHWRDWCNHRDRYRFVNWGAYTKHNTVEIRGHEGTLSTCEVCNWVTAHTRFFDYVKDLGFAEIDKLFSGVNWRDFDTFGKIVGRDIATFYEGQAAKHGRTVSIIKNRFAPLECGLAPC